MGLLNSPLGSVRQFPMFTVKIVITELDFTATRSLLNLNKMCQHHRFLLKQKDCSTRTGDMGVLFSLFDQLRDLSVECWLAGTRQNIWEIIKQNLSKSSSGVGRPPVVSEPGLPQPVNSELFLSLGRAEQIICLLINCFWLRSMEHRGAQHQTWSPGRHD